MPLLKYFVSVGVLLTALLVLTDFLYEPSIDALPETAFTRHEVNLPKPKIYSRVGKRAVGIPQTTSAPAMQARSAPIAEPPRQPTKPPAKQIAAAPESPPTETAAAPNTARKAKPRRKTAKVRTRRQNNDVAWRHPDSNPGYMSYAQERRGWPQFPQTNSGMRAAPPFFAQGGAPRPFF